MREPWVDVALARLPETRSCPACAAPLRSSRCDRCLLDLVGPLAFEVAAASTDAADALRRRQTALDTLRAAQPEAAAWAARAAVAPPPGMLPGIRPGGRPGAAAGGGWRTPAGPPPMRLLDASGRGAAGPRSSTLSPVAGPGGPVRPGAAGPVVPVPAPGPAGPRAGGVGPGAAPARSVGLQPVLAGAGAGLLAVAAVVFVFFTFADDLALRALVTGVVTALTVGAAVLLRSRGLRSSAEAVAALAVVLALVDVELALSAWALDPVGAAAARATLLAVVLVGLGVVGERARVRAWVTGAVVLGPLVPLVAAPAAQASWGWAVALLVTACLTAVAGPVAAAAGARVGGTLGAERGFLGVVRTVAVLLAVLVGFTVAAPPGLPGGAGAALVALGAALVATLLRVTTGERRWYAVGGAAAVLAGALLGTGDGVGFVGLAPALGALAWVVVLVLTGRRVSAGVLRVPVPPIGRSDALLGGAVVVLVMAGPALALAGLRAAEVLVTPTAGTSAGLAAWR